MNVLIMTNTYKPFVGGVERSVDSFTGEYRRLGHKVMIVAPSYSNMAPDEEGVVRLPSFKNFNHTEFSATWPVHPNLGAEVKEFGPDIIHSQHPFMIGDTAFRLSIKFQLPLVFTYHTFYEEYTHYMPGNSLILKKFVKALSVAYSNLCDQVFAPSQSVEAELRKRGVKTPIEVVPTGIDVQGFAAGDGASFRRSRRIPAEAFVIGFVSRIAPEKNLGFLMEAVARFLKEEGTAHLLMIGRGPSEKMASDFFAQEKVSDRVHLPGFLEGRDLVDAYHAMNVFAFASQSETQGLVLSEAMAAGVPVVAVDAPGVREIVSDSVNGRLLPSENVQEFVAALGWVRDQTSGPQKNALARRALETAQRFEQRSCALRAMEIYGTMIGRRSAEKKITEGHWADAMRALKAEWEITKIMAKATQGAFHTESVQA